MSLVVQRGTRGAGGQEFGHRGSTLPSDGGSLQDRAMVVAAVGREAAALQTDDIPAQVALGRAG